MKGLRRLILVAGATLLMASQATAATITAAGFTAFDTYEIEVTADIPAGERGIATINAPVDLGVMSWNLEGPFVSLVEPLRSGSLFPGTSEVRNYFNETTNDGSLVLTTAWLADTWRSATNWASLDNAQQTAFLDDLVGSTLVNFESAGGSGGGSGDGGMGGGGGVSPVPLPASSLLLIAGLAGLGAMRRKGAAT